MRFIPLIADAGFLVIGWALVSNLANVVNSSLILIEHLQNKNEFLSKINGQGGLICGHMDTRMKLPPILTSMSLCLHSPQRYALTEEESLVA